MAAGTVLASKYELIAVAGEGGMATVWKARTLGAAGFTRTVAVKRILDGLADNSEAIAMFVEEARVVSELSHPNIVQIHDFDEDEAGSYFLVMEWVEGLTLSRWCMSHEQHRDPTPWPLVTAIGIEVLKGLSAAHERVGEDGRRAPVFHRDVSPHNVLMGQNGIVKLSDFGLARAMDRARMTQPHMVKGKLSYLSPELTHAKDPSAQSDLFAVGIVLFEALSGRKLFDAVAPIEILQQVREKVTPDLKAIRPDLPQGVVAAVERALRKDPAERFGSAREMSHALAQVLRASAEPTGSDVIARSVAHARERFVEPRPDAAPQAPAVADSGMRAIPLTRRKR